MPMIARMFRNVPLAISRPAWTGTTTRPAIGMMHHAMAPADSHDRETGPLKRPDHLHPRNGREGAGHQATSRVSVSSSGGPTSASNASSASRRSATAASAVAPSPTAPTPGRNCAEAHQNAVFVLFDDVRHMNDAGHRVDSPTPGAWHGSAPRVVLGQPQNRRRTAAGLVHGLFSKTGSASRICRRRSPGNGDGHPSTFPHEFDYRRSGAPGFGDLRH